MEETWKIIEHRKEAKKHHEHGQNEKGREVQTKGTKS